MGKTILIDTNLYLDDANIIFKLSGDGNNILVPITVLKELDQKKYNKDFSYSARNAIRAINDFMGKHPDNMVFDVNRYKEADTPDERILMSASNHGAVIATKDVSMSMTAKSMGMDSLLQDTVLSGIFDPYVYVTMDQLYGASGKDLFAFKQEYKGGEYFGMLDMLSGVCGRHLDAESWFFVFIKTESNKPVIYANNPFDVELERIDIMPEFREIHNDGVTVKARDCYQICAFYAMAKAPHVLITGRWGSGKSLLSTSYAITATEKKIFITRAPIGIDSKYSIGFLPGSREEKMLDWLQGFMSATYYLYANTRTGRQNSYDYVKDRIFNGRFEIVAMNSIQGMSLLDGDILIVDECQLIDINHMSMIMSRPSGSSKLILLGDIKQTYDVVKPSESGLLKLLRVLPHKHMAYVELQNSYRSPLLEIADELQNKSIM